MNHGCHDEQSILSIMADCLQDAGYQTYVAFNGDEGLAQLDQLQPDLVISDVWMPGMDGYHFCRLVRKRASYARILMITGVRQEAAVLKEMEIDIDGYLVKPFGIGVFLQHVETLLQRKDSNGSSAEESQVIVESQAVSVDKLLSSREDRLLEMYRMLSASDRELLEVIAVRFFDATGQAEHPIDKLDHLAPKGQTMVGEVVTRRNESKVVRTRHSTEEIVTV